MAPGLCNTELPACLKFLRYKITLSSFDVQCIHALLKALYPIISIDLSGVGRQHMKLVHHQTQFAQVDVKVDHHISRHGRREHLLLEERTFQLDSIKLNSYSASYKQNCL